MNLIKPLLLIACASISLGSAHSYAVTECFDAGNTVEIMTCFIEKQEQAEKLLNGTYQRLIALAKNNFDTEVENDLRRAQRAWINYRKLNCQFYSRKDRARHNLEATDCMLRMTREREAELRAAAEELASR
jgi:uncharacterized protein YecT (DUF1311 family)